MKGPAGRRSGICRIWGCFRAGKENCSMLKYIIKRILIMIPIFLIASFVIFMLVRLAPGDVAASIVGGGKTTEATLEAIRQKYHLNDPVLVQYWIWLKGVFRGDWGDSYQMNAPVLMLIRNRIGLTFQLLGMGFVIGILVSLPLGIAAAVNRGRFFDKVCSILTVISAACPAYFIGMLLMLFLAYRCGLFPVYGSGKGFVQNLYYLFLPALAVGIGMIAMNARTLRASMINTLESNFILTAQAKGLAKVRIILYHALKSSIIPYFTISGVQLADMIGSTSIIERTFSISGIGSLLVDSVTKNDYPVVQGVTLVIVIMVMVINLVVDVLCALVDKRIRLR